MNKKKKRRKKLANRMALFRKKVCQKRVKENKIETEKKMLYGNCLMNKISFIHEDIYHMYPQRKKQDRSERLKLKITCFTESRPTYRQKRKVL